MFCSIPASAQQNADNLTKYVNPFIGTGAVDQNSLSGSNFTGATVLFGMVKLSPDTRMFLMDHVQAMTIAVSKIDYKYFRYG